MSSLSLYDVTPSLLLYDINCIYPVVVLFLQTYTAVLCYIQRCCVIYSGVVLYTAVLCYIQRCCVIYSGVVLYTAVLCYIQLCCVIYSGAVLYLQTMRNRLFSSNLDIKCSLMYSHERCSLTKGVLLPKECSYAVSNFLSRHELCGVRCRWTVGNCHFLIFKKDWCLYYNIRYTLI